MKNTNNNIQQHLWTIINYLWDAEECDYEARSDEEETPEETEPHIFESLVIIKQWLQETFPAAK